jgi:hypothetical protein
MNICNFLKDIYNVFFLNIKYYFFPVSVNIDLKTNHYYDDFKHNFIYKINKVEYNNYKFYNYGYVYQTSDTTYNYDDLNIAYAPDTIQAIHLKLATTYDNYELIINNYFINSILLFSTEKSILETLLYYYLRYHLNNYDIILSVRLQIDDKEYDIDYKDTLYNIYDNLEKIID